MIICDNLGFNFNRFSTDFATHDKYVCLLGCKAFDT